MEPIDFEHSNLTLRKPSDMKDEDCSSLRVFAGPIRLNSGETCSGFVCCYQMDEADIDELLRNKGKIYIIQLGAGFKPIEPTMFDPFGMIVIGPQPSQIIKP